MPGGDLHEELSRLAGLDPKVARRVQKLMDSTSQTHGGRHRSDPVHSLGGAVLELAKQGELNPETVRAAAQHLIQDQLGDALNAANPIRGPLRGPSKQVVEALLVQGLRAARGRR